MNSFAILADDVEDADDLAPKPKVVEPEEPVVKQTMTTGASSSRSGGKNERRDGSKGNVKGGSRGGGRSSFKGDQRGRRDKREGKEANGSAEPEPGNIVEAEGGDGDDKTSEEAIEEGPADMSLDEYLAQRKEEARVELRKAGTGVSRKANEVGGKMLKLTKKNEPKDASETSIMSAVSLKKGSNERAVKDSTHTAVAHNAKNQEFFRNAPGQNSNRSYRGRGGGRGRGGRDYRGGRDFRGDRDYRNRFDGRRVKNGANAVQSPNVDDPTAFPSLSA